MTGNQFHLSDAALISMVRNRGLAVQFGPRHHAIMQHWRKGKLLGEYHAHNDITNEGKNLIFDVMFNNATQISNSSWYIGLISLTGFSALAATDVMNSHSGWTEFTAYTQAARPGWGSGVAASQSVTNATPIQYDINASGTVKGVFVPSNNVKSGTTGKLWATALFAADVPVSNGDQLKVTYTVSA